MSPANLTQLTFAVPITLVILTLILRAERHDLVRILWLIVSAVNLRAVLGGPATSPPCPHCGQTSS